MLPIVQKIYYDIFILQDYAVQEGQINGISRAIDLTGKPKIRVLFCDNCSLNDNMTANLFSSLAKQKSITEIIFKRNTFLEQSLISLKSILSLKPPCHLLELRLVNC